MDLKVQQDEEARKFHAEVEGREVVIEYEKRGDVYDLTHTRVPDELSGRGLGGQLVQGTLDEIARQGARFLPTCPFIQAFLKKHPEYQKGVADG